MSSCTTRYLELQAIDSWFFREPRPFHADESAAGGIGSLFPPPARTLVGAVRAALARAAGWDGRGPWSAGVRTLLGDGDDLGRLRFVGPMVCDTTRGPLFPLPQHVLVDSSKETLTPTAILAPGEKVACDLGHEVRLPFAAGELAGSGTVQGWWATAAALESILAGRQPAAAEMLAPQEVFRSEPRVGIGRDAATRMAKDHALYAARFVRPRDSIKILVGVAGLPANAPWPARTLVAPLGGEGRAAALGPALEPVFPAAPHAAIRRSSRYTVTFLTPAFLPAEAWTPGAALPGLPGVIVSACLAEPIRIGGWSSLDGKSVPALSAVPAGSTFFFELEGDPSAVLKLHGTHFDPDGAGRWGYGRMAIGAWSTDAAEGETA